MSALPGSWYTISFRFQMSFSRDNQQCFDFKVSSHVTNALHTTLTMHAYFSSSPAGRPLTSLLSSQATITMVFQHCADPLRLDYFGVRRTEAKAKQVSRNTAHVNPTQRTSVLVVLNKYDQLRGFVELSWRARRNSTGMWGNMRTVYLRTSQTWLNVSLTLQTSRLTITSASKTDSEKTVASLEPRSS
jgi:hypothetical protein